MGLVNALGSATPVFLGTVALEPNRWGAVSADRAPAISVDDWLSGAVAARFDGIELWENHAAKAPPADVDALLRSRVPVRVFNSYAPLDETGKRARDEAAGWARRFSAKGVKFNVGRDPSQATGYSERLREWSEALPDETALICECHAGSAAEDPEIAALVLEGAGPPSRFQALVHLGDERATIEALFDALGPRVTHVHVNFLRRGAPPLCEIAGLVRDRVGVLAERNFAGTFTLEFVNGVGTDRDHPAATLAAAVRDLAFLREVLASCGS